MGLRRLRAKADTVPDSATPTLDWQGREGGGHGYCRVERPIREGNGGEAKLKAKQGAQKSARDCSTGRAV